MPAAALEHARQHLAAQLDRREEVEGDDGLELVGGQVGEVPRDLGARVVDEHVDRSGDVLGPGHEATEVVAGGEVGRHGAAAHRDGDLREGLAAARDDGEAGARTREAGREVAPDVTGRSGEQDVGPGEAHPASVADRTPVGVMAGGPPDVAVSKVRDVCARTGGYGILGRVR